jgi:hypothetical protein
MSEIRGRAAKTGGPISFERLEVFKRAYRISLQIHRASLNFPDNEPTCLGGSNPSGQQIHLRQLGGGIWKAIALEGGVPTLYRNGIGFRRRDANVGPVLFGPRICGRSDMDCLAR